MSTPTPSPPARLSRTLAEFLATTRLDDLPGAVQHEAEWRLLFKTTAAAYPSLEVALRAQHPYELPAIVAWPCSAALPEFAAWVAGEVAAG